MLDVSPALGPHVHDHLVQFYERDEFLAEIVVDFLVQGAAAGEPAVVIASPAHGTAFLAGLRMAGLDVEARIAAGTLVVLDAHATLGSFMRHDRPDPVKFRAVIGEVLARTRACADGASVRAYGEMVDVLWRAGHAAAAVELEELWNQLAHEHAFTLLCGYGMGGFVREADSPGFARVCGAHSHVLASEAFRGLPDRAAELREVARLQQRARVLEDELAHRREVERALVAAIRLRDDFVAVAGHELRTPLTAARLHVESALAALEAAAPARTRARLDQSLLQMQRLGGLIESLLDASRLTAGQIELAPAEVELGELVRDVVERASPLAARAGCAVQLRVAAPSLGRWDAGRIDQVVSNLLANAIKYGAGAPVDVVVGGDAATAQLAIRDHGIGIAPEDHDRIFERFERAASPQHFAGLGLGLWIVRELTHAHGGSVTVDSQLGTGATFTLRLPRRLDLAS